jgi:hypothetical protein
MAGDSGGSGAFSPPKHDVTVVQRMLAACSGSLLTSIVGTLDSFRALENLVLLSWDTVLIQVEVKLGVSSVDLNPGIFATNVSNAF